MVNLSWDDWKIQIHCNNHEWVNIINSSEEKNPFYTSSKKFYLKDINKTSHWEGYSKLKPLYLENLIKENK